MNTADVQYLNHAQDLLDRGVYKSDRTGTGTRSIFGHQMRFDLRQGFPLLTTKKVFLRGIIHELLWFLRGDTNIQSLVDAGVHIWDEWADEHGELGPVYGKQWRSWRTYERDVPEYINDGILIWNEGQPIDQIARVMEGMKSDPYGRRHIVTAWNPADVDSMALPPCHCFFQFMVEPMSIRERVQWNCDRGGNLMEPITHDALDCARVPRNWLSCQLYQRSADWFLGVPFNIASYALLTHMVAKVLGYAPKEFIHSFGDTHIYENHIDQVRLQLSREPRPLPVLAINGDQKTIDDFKFEDFVLSGYDPHLPIKAEVAV